MNDFETGVAVGYLLHKDSGSSIILDTFSTIQNGHWTAQSGHAWNDITVNVPTYEQEYRQMQAECEKVKEAIKPYDPTLPVPWDPIHDPTQPTIEEEINKIAGYEPPNDPPRADVIDALVPLGGGDVDTVVTGTAVGYTYKLEFAGFGNGAYALYDRITGEAINDVVVSDVFEHYYEGEFKLGDYIYPICKITIEGLDGVNSGYCLGGIGFFNAQYPVPTVSDEWKFGIEDIIVTNNASGHFIAVQYYPSAVGWITGQLAVVDTITKDSVTTKVYTQQ